MARYARLSAEAGNSPMQIRVDSARSGTTDPPLDVLSGAPKASPRLVVPREAPFYAPVMAVSGATPYAMEEIACEINKRLVTLYASLRLIAVAGQSASVHDALHGLGEVA